MTRCMATQGRYFERCRAFGRVSMVSPSPPRKVPLRALQLTITLDRTINRTGPGMRTSQDGVFTVSAFLGAAMLLSGCAAPQTTTEVLRDSRVYRDDAIVARCTVNEREGVQSSGPCTVGSRRVVVGGEVVYRRGAQCYRDIYAPDRSESNTPVVHAEVPCPGA